MSKLSSLLDSLSFLYKMVFMRLCLESTRVIFEVYGASDVLNRTMKIADRCLVTGFVDDGEIRVVSSLVQEYFGQSGEDPGARVVAACELFAVGIVKGELPIRNILNTIDWAIESVDVPPHSGEAVAEENAWRKQVVQLLCDNGTSKNSDMDDFLSKTGEPQWAVRFLKDVYQA